MTYIYNISGMTCGGCVASVEEKLSKIVGVNSVSVDLGTAEAKIEMARHIPIKQLQEALKPKYEITEKEISVTQNHQEVLPIEEKSKIEQLKPLFLILGYLSMAVVLLNYKEGSLNDAMLDFMGLFYIVFSFFKFLDFKGFPESFRMYDPLAKAIPVYGSIYPFIEAALGILFLMRIQIPLTLIITVIILGITTLGVTKTLLDKKSIRCACLGTSLKLPMTEATFIENAIMLTMATAMLIQIYS
jgi:copper chaperone CopZ